MAPYAILQPYYPFNYTHIYMNYAEKLHTLKNIHGEGLVSIIAQTHRTKPDNAKDPLTLKNLIKEAHERLLNEYDKNYARDIIEAIESEVAQLDHNYNLDSIAIFAQPGSVDIIRMPITVTNRVSIDTTFATRDIVRALHSESAYYVLVLSRQNARLIEMYNDTVVQEFDNASFPYENDTLYSTDKQQLSTKQGQDNLIEEFFNRIDKELHTTINDHPLPILLATEKRNVDHYMKIADRKERIAGSLDRVFDNADASEIARAAWPEMQRIITEKNQARLSELGSAVSSGLFASDYSDMWRLIHEGRGKTLFVKRGHFQPARIDDMAVETFNEMPADTKGIVDDIIDELIEQNLRFGGDVVFIDDEGLDAFQDCALTLRY